MKKYLTSTTNRGTTIILDSVQDAIEWGRKVNGNQLGWWYNNQSDLMSQYEDCCKAIVEGWNNIGPQISELAEEIKDLVLEMEPLLSTNRAGFETSVEGFDASPELLAAGEERCVIDHKHMERPKEGKGGGAYRILISTDVSWWGKPEWNAAMVGALVIILQQSYPVEVWVQQGWLGGSQTDGITLFKLDYTGSFNPTQLAFWCGHPGKDTPFSFVVNRALGRLDNGTAVRAEIECDLYLRGDWFALVGMSASQLTKMSYTDRLDFLSKWVQLTCMKMQYGDGFNTGFNPNIVG